jgi:hypothetical protein
MSQFTGLDISSLICWGIAIVILIVIIIVIFWIAVTLGLILKPIDYPNQVAPDLNRPKPYPPPSQPPVNQPPPSQVYTCAYCGQPLGYQERYKRWYCNSCGKYS